MTAKKAYSGGTRSFPWPEHLLGGVSHEPAQLVELLIVKGPETVLLEILSKLGVLQIQVSIAFEAEIEMLKIGIDEPVYFNLMTVVTCRVLQKLASGNPLNLAFSGVD